MHSCARASSGAVSCWGNGNNGRLGQGSSATTATPVAVRGPALSGMDLGARYSCGTMTTGTVICWGEGYFGQLGLGNTVDRNVPSHLSGLPAIREISAALRHTCAVSAALRSGRITQASLNKAQLTNQLSAAWPGRA